MIDVRHCSIDDLEIEPGSTPLILTDPPYGAVHDHLLDSLGRFAVATLADGGSLVAMIGQRQLAYAVSLLVEIGLDYQWTFSYLTPGANAKIGGHWRLFAGWKPIVWFSRGEPSLRRRRWMEDRLVSRRMKQHHEWGQDVAPFERLVRGFTHVGDLVVDPFAGGGTTAVACALHWRDFLGCDVDLACVERTRARAEAAIEFRGSLRVGAL